MAGGILSRTGVPSEPGVNPPELTSGRHRVTLPAQSESRTARELNRSHERSEVTLPRLKHAPSAHAEGIHVRNRGFHGTLDASYQSRMTDIR